MNRLLWILAALSSLLASSCVSPDPNFTKGFRPSAYRETLDEYRYLQHSYIQAQFTKENSSTLIQEAKAAPIRAKLEFEKNLLTECEFDERNTAFTFDGENVGVPIRYLGSDLFDRYSVLSKKCLFALLESYDFRSLSPGAYSFELYYLDPVTDHKVIMNPLVSVLVRENLPTITLPEVFDELTRYREYREQLVPSDR